MRIVQLTSENVKRLKAVQVTPDGAIVQISGRNGQGKSSLLDSIAMVIGGADEICDEPVRKGEKKAKIVATMDEDGLIVTRTFTASGGTTLTVTNADGLKYPSPQAILDKLVGRLSFDPLAFSRMPAKQQVDTLRQLVGLDFTKMDAERKGLYDQRALKNSNAKQLESQAAGIAAIPTNATKEISVADLLAEAEKRRSVNDGNAAMRRKLDGYRTMVDQQATENADMETEEASAKAATADVLTEIEQERKRRIAEVNADCDRQIATTTRRDSEREARYHQAIEAARSRRVECAATLAQVEAATVKLADLDVGEITQKIAEAGTFNQRFRDHQRREELKERARIATSEADELTAKIEAIDAEKSELLASASFPVPGLAFTDSGVVYNGVPFSQASSAEQLRVSVAMGIAMNPKLRVMLIRDGSLLDSDGMKMLAEFAEKNNAQIWVERVADKGAVGVVIEDGMVADGN